MKKILNFFTPMEYCYLIISYATLITFGIIYRINALEIISTLLGLLAAILNIKKKRIAFIFYALYVSIYGAMSFANKQYGEGILNLCYNLPLYIFTIYSLYFSKKNKENTDQTFTINSLKAKHYIIIGIMIPAVTVGYGFALKALGSNLPFVNALATSVAVIASFLASKRMKQQWIFWNLYSFVLIYLWLYTFQTTGSNGLVYLILNFFYVGINTYGYITWIKQYKRQVLTEN